MYSFAENNSRNVEINLRRGKRRLIDSKYNRKKERDKQKHGSEINAVGRNKKEVREIKG